MTEYKILSSPFWVPALVNTSSFTASLQICCLLPLRVELPNCCLILNNLLLPTLCCCFASVQVHLYNPVSTKASLGHLHIREILLNEWILGNHWGKVAVVCLVTGVFHLGGWGWSVQLYLGGGAVKGQRCKTKSEMNFIYNSSTVNHQGAPGSVLLPVFSRQPLM